MRRLPFLLLALLPCLPPAASAACGRSVGFIGRPALELRPFLQASGFTTFTAETATAASNLVSIEPDVIFVVRSGADVARSVAPALNAWVLEGGLLITEYTATQLLFEPGFLHHMEGALVDDFWVPSGTACGGNAIRVETPGLPIAEGLPAAWACSGDPMGTLQVFTGVDEGACVVLSVVGSDRDGDGRDDPVLAVKPIGAAGGGVAAFFSDFGNFQPAEDPRQCPGGPLSASCRRHPLDEQVLLNVVCHGDELIDCHEELLPVGCGDCDALREGVAVAEIDIEGLRRSLAAKVRAACASLRRGRRVAAGQQLCALLHELDAQEGRHVTADSAASLRACVESLAEVEDLSLGIPVGACGDRRAPGARGSRR